MEGLLGPESDSLAILAGWERWLRASYAETTVKNYWGYAFRFLRACPKPLTFVTEQDIAAWLETYPYRSQSRRDGHLAAKSLFGWMEGHRLIVLNPVTGIRVPPVHEKEPRALTEAEFQAVYQAAYQRAPHRAHAIALLFYTGGRLKEVVNLRWDDVKSDSLILRVTKNGKERTIPMTAMLYEALSGLAERFGQGDRVIPRSGGTIWLWCRDAGRDAGIERVHPHLFRSSLASTLVNSGTPVPVASKLLGHQSLKVTSRYLATNREQAQEAMDSLPRFGPSDAA